MPRTRPWRHPEISRTGAEVSMPGTALLLFRSTGAAPVEPAARRPPGGESTEAQCAGDPTCTSQGPDGASKFVKRHGGSALGAVAGERLAGLQDLLLSPAL